jgi:seryl-tRNA synthetase
MSELLRHPELRWHSNGQSSFHGDLFRLFLALDRTFVSIARKFSATEHRFPIFISAAELQRIDYLSSFPHLATFPIALENEPGNLSHFVETNPLAPNGAVKLTRTAEVKDLLTPAACYHFYVHHQGSVLEAPLFLTTCASCFRREAHYAPLERQWSFAMREIVCIGSSEEVQDFLSKCQAEVGALLTELGLKIEWMNATDPFFNPSKNPKFLMQKLAPNKTEMIFDGRLAIGSVNFHRNYFGEAFKISRGEQEAYSGCVAFGLERWMSAILHQFGSSRHEWPTPLKALLGETSR